MEPTPGAMLTANIRLERALARGGMGSLWLADHLGLHTKLVVTFIAENGRDGEAFVKVLNFGVAKITNSGGFDGLLSPTGETSKRAGSVSVQPLIGFGRLGLAGAF